ncbi:MAG: WbuC family cupin fold metalloprotein [Methylocystis sp.]
MASVFRHCEELIVVDADWIERVKDAARAEPLRRARLNLHHSEDAAVQEMLIAFCDDSLIPPHRHIGKSESLHALEGRALIVFFDDEGAITRDLVIGAAGTGLPSLYRLAASHWHTVIPLDDMVVIHEVTTGPFRREEGPAPSWTPKGEAELRALIDQIKARFLASSGSTPSS